MKQSIHGIGISGLEGHRENVYLPCDDSENTDIGMKSLDISIE